MNLAFYSGLSGMMAYQYDIDQLAHNMANVNTYGYKPGRLTFQDILYTKMDINNETPELVGHGVRPQSVDVLHKQQPLMMTGYPLDFAINGEGYFGIDRNGQREYTRNGAFDISVQGKDGYLVTADGAYVLDSKGSHIKLDRVSGSSLFDTDGVGDKLGIFQFDNPQGLEQTDHSSFLETTLSGTALVVAENGTREGKAYELVNQALESSGTDVAQGMVDVMMAQRAFQFSSKIVQTADQIEEIVNTLR